MRTMFTCFLCGLLFFSSCVREPENQHYDLQFHSFGDISQHFEDPPLAFKTVPFWVWNTGVTKELIDRDLEDFKNRGFGGVFLHPRYGLITEYLSDEWFDLAEYAVQKGKEIGLYVWIYDENSFPSGFAGGHVPAEMPESYNQGIALRMHRQSVLMPENGTEYKHIMVKDGDGYVEISGQTEAYLGKPGDFLLFETLYYPQTKWYGGYSYVDLMVEGVTEKFIELTMTGYEERVGEDFGGWVPGVFTDEPNISSRGHGQVIRWTPELYASFESSWGYDLVPHLVSLLEDVGDWTQVRHNYYATQLQLFIDRWSKPWYEYTEARDLKWTGHYWEHGWPSPFHGGDNMAMYAWHQLPGIDMLFNTWEERPDQFGNARAVKELSSVANQMGRHRTLSETYGAAGWELTFRDMKRNGDWEYVLGVNLMNQHLSYMTLMGDRKHDFPQSFSFHAPYWDYYHYQAEYYARLSMALSSGKQLNDILVIEPTSTMWMHYTPIADNEKMHALGDAFEAFIDELEKHQVEYDLGCENIIKDQGRVVDGSFTVGQRDYKLVVLPPGLENLDGTTAELLGQYLEEGGKVLSFVQPPQYIDGMYDPMLENMLERFMGQCVVADEGLSGAELQLMQPEGIRFEGIDEATGLLFHHRRMLDDGQLIFLVNSNTDRYESGSFTCNGTSVALLDAESGEIHGYPAECSGDECSVRFELPPAGSLLLFVSDSETDYPVKAAMPDEWMAVDPAGDLSAVPESKNNLVLDYCLLTLGEEKQKEHYFYTASDKIFKHHGFDDNPWVSSSQYKTEILDRDTFGVDRSGFIVDFPFVIEGGLETDGFRAVVERPELYSSIQVNGQEIRPLEGEWWLDEVFGVFEIGEFLTGGTNMLRLVANPMSVHLELEPVFITGDFAVEPAEKGWLLKPPYPVSLGSWKEQGRPFYHDAVSYSSEYVVTQTEKSYRLRLGAWDGTVAAVKVNGEEAGILYCEPYELDLTGMLAEGSNKVTVTVIGSLKNLLGPHHNVTRKGLVTPWSFKYAPEIQPPGKAYDLFDYGLYEPFELLIGST